MASFGDLAKQEPKTDEPKAEEEKVVEVRKGLQGHWKAPTKEGRP